MKNRVFILALVVVIAIFLGVTITVKQTNDPLLKRIVDQQSQILQLQQKLDRQLSGVAGGGAVGSDSGARLAALEKKVDTLVGFFKAAVDRQGPQQPQAPSDEYTKVHDINLEGVPVKGKKDAPITIVEFVDFECPFCARFHPALDEVVKAYPDKVNYVIKNFPLSFHQQAKPAAKAALAAGEQGKYFEMADLILNNQRELTEDKFKEWAGSLGLNVDQFMKDLKENDAKYEAIIQEDMKEGMAVEVRGTPTFYINGRKTMARDLNGYKQEIEKILNQE